MCVQLCSHCVCAVRFRYGLIYMYMHIFFYIFKFTHEDCTIEGIPNYEPAVHWSSANPYQGNADVLIMVVHSGTPASTM